MVSPLNPSDPLVVFSKYLPSTEDLLKSADYSHIPRIGGQSASDAKSAIISAFNSTSPGALSTNPPRILEDLKSTIRQSFEATRQSSGMIEGYATLFATWPPVLPHRTSPLGLLFLYLLTLIHDVERPLDLVNWIANEAAAPNWHGANCNENSIISVVSMIKQKKKVMFAMLDRDEHLRLESLEADGFRAVVNARIRNVEVAGKSVKVFFENGTCQSFVPRDPQIWASPKPFPLNFDGLEPPFPIPVLSAFYEALTSNDFVLLQAITHFRVIPVKEGMPFVDALINIFAHAGKIDQFLVTLVGVEFTRAELAPNTVVRVNTHVTNLFKAWFARFARPYWDSVLSKIVDYIINAGNIGLSAPDSADVEKAEKLLFTVFKYILASGPRIPHEIRHLASILKAAAISRFNTKHATYNTLAGFICLRFITAVISFPADYRPSLGELSPETMQMLMPFSQLLQTPINLVPLDGRYQVFAGWNLRLERHVWPKLISWVLSIADLPEKPVYVPPSQSVVEESLTKVLAAVSQRFTQFKEQYEFFSQQKQGQHPIRWDLAAFLSGFFEETQ